MAKNSSFGESSKSTGMHAAFGTSAGDFGVVHVVHFKEFSIFFVSWNRLDAKIKEDKKKRPSTGQINS
ncbi:hypothetical protein RO3G_15899 [Rhizopus delemar RA 99-880]|uniref:Uncharacterized protein n=1 Tax=Rhizopus delemar (strain RA 99-880 / ATCC MYA-4621 / FGSC 9543 / NRRL 43880) TaxID=246409 RepID=I1C3I7_RHIO9|nr:hypothetical protein RO3G_04213 [Rhizopus delemar RA 99-880]EIE82603.1 hypothetical protein RO3G_07308 [Rhizopus delemar RA 99-880]EIE82994.1 hypothetical protein RO3G_07699 [Rhizopus delemar RA 99-880]EIE83017.1 hypothetical protein RO3G_07722 [Rhizopus delemar RA 99-880]EIE84890.1 hypothetical protein RO3G_09600 [Rhizopus delemar RA 99-880]|eukprot:EIE79508.1 hypothetical protein RO3G_04213 [Rhizopus delemar RA 99-880]